MQIDSLAAMWENSLRLYASRTAVVYGDVRRDYSTVVARARRLGRFLHRMGVERGDRVAMLSMNRAEWIDYYAACELHGYIAMTVNFRLAVREIEYVLADGTPTVLLFEHRYADAVERLRDRSSFLRAYVCLDADVPWAPSLKEVLAGESDDEPVSRAEPDDPVHMIYTSGTTGRPKGVLRSQRAGAALAGACATSQNMRVEGRILLTMPMFHVGAQSMASGQHLVGGMVVLHDRFDPLDVARTIEDERIDTTHMAPTLVQRFLEEPGIDGFDLSSLRTLCYAAAPMPIPVLREGLRRLGPVFLNCYGSTECGNVAVMQQQFHEPDAEPRLARRLGSVGREHLFSTLRVFDDDGSEVQRGEVGELCVRSGSMMSGYWNQPEATAEAFRDGWYRTGDMAEMDEDGFVYLVDRRKDMIISGGENIYSREVEEALLTHPAIESAAVIGVSDEHWGEAVKAVLVSGDPPPDEALIAHCRQLIAGYKVPRHFAYVDALPVLATGKVDKVALRAAHSQQTTRSDI